MSDRAPTTEIALFGLRPRLVRFFSGRGLAWAADDLADDVILRVLKKVRQGEAIESLHGFALGVARLVLLEQLRGPDSRQVPLDVDVQAPDTDETESAAQDCLDRCLGELPPRARELILRFYGQGRHGAKIMDVRRHLAGDLAISMDALYLRASKLRRTLRACVESCSGESGASRGQKPAGSITPRGGSE